MASSSSEGADTQAFTGLLMTACTIAALSSFLLFGLQPLAVAEMGHWHAPGTVIHFFQWTYLIGVALPAISSGLAPGLDLRVAAAVFVPVAIYTVVMVLPAGPHRLGHLAPVAIWLACSSTILVRALGRAPTTYRLRPYSILASSNAGALLGVLVWLHPTHAPATAPWVVVGTLLFVIGASLLVVQKKVGEAPPQIPSGKASPVAKRGVLVILIWFALAMSASLAMMLAQGLFVADESSPSMMGMQTTGTALPLLVFLLAYVVGWSQPGKALIDCGGRWFRHLIASGVVAAWTLAHDPPMAAVSLALYVFCALCVALLRRSAPPPAKATLFQIVQALGGVCGGWLALHMQ